MYFKILSKYSLLFLFSCLNGSLRRLNIIKNEFVTLNYDFHNLELVQNKIIDYLTVLKII